MGEGRIAVEEGKWRERGERTGSRQQSKQERFDLGLYNEIIHEPFGILHLFTFDRL
jgi:hypothetical protein